jgi:hypothetical protein
LFKYIGFNPITFILFYHKKLHNKYFTPFSLIRLIDYFITSRLAYGLSGYLDHNARMKQLNLVLTTHLKSIFDLPIQTSHKLIHLLIGEPDIQTRLTLRLLKNWFKYRNHFGVFPEKLRVALTKYFGAEKLIDEKKINYEAEKTRLFDVDLNEKALEAFGVRIRSKHADFLKKHIYVYSTLEDYYLIRYFTKTCKADCS